VHVETGRAGEKLANRRLAYVALSRGRYDARIYTDDKGQLARILDRDVSHRSALARDSEPSSVRATGRQTAPRESVSQTMAIARL
jgi:hypothetical protein